MCLKNSNASAVVLNVLNVLNVLVANLTFIMFFFQSIWVGVNLFATFKPTFFLTIKWYILLLDHGWGRVNIVLKKNT